MCVSRLKKRIKNYALVLLTYRSDYVQEHLPLGELKKLIFQTIFLTCRAEDGPAHKITFCHAAATHNLKCLSARRTVVRTVRS